MCFTRSETNRFPQTISEEDLVSTCLKERSETVTPAQKAAVQGVVGHKLVKVIVPHRLAVKSSRWP